MGIQKIFTYMLNMLPRLSLLSHLLIFSFLNFIVGFHIYNFQFRPSRQERIKPMNHITDKTYFEKKNCSQLFLGFECQPSSLGFL